MRGKRAAATKRVTPNLGRADVEFLDRLGNEAKFGGGRMLGKTKLIIGMAEALREIAPDVGGARTEDDLVGRILEPGARKKRRRS